MFKYSGFLLNTIRKAIAAYMKLREELNPNSMEVQLSKSSPATIRELSRIVAAISGVFMLLQSVEYIMKAVNLFDSNLLRKNPVLIDGTSSEPTVVGLLGSNAGACKLTLEQNVITWARILQQNWVKNYVLGGPTGLICSTFPGKARLVKKMAYTDIISLYKALRENPFPLVFDHIKLYRFLLELTYTNITNMRHDLSFRHKITETHNMAVCVHIP